MLGTLAVLGNPFVFMRLQNSDKYLIMPNRSEIILRCTVLLSIAKRLVFLMRHQIYG